MKNQTQTQTETETPITTKPYKNPPINLPKSEFESICKEMGFITKSSKIRYLLLKGYPQSSISKYLGVLPQFVSNIKNKPLKRVTPS